MEVKQSSQSFIHSLISFLQHKDLLPYGFEYIKYERVSLWSTEKKIVNRVVSVNSPRNQLSCRDAGDVK